MIRAQLPFAAIILGLSLAFYFLIIAPLSIWREDTISSLLSVQTEKEELSQSIMRLQAERDSYAREDLTGVMWQASQMGQATARVQSALNDIARRNGIAMRSIAPINGQSNEVAFRLEFEASLDQLVPFLKQVEYDQPVLLISRASLRRLVRPNNISSQPDILVQIDIAAPVTLIDEPSE